MAPALINNDHLGSLAVPPGANHTVLVSEKISADGLALLKKEFEVHERFSLSAEEICNVIKEYDALIVRSETKVTKELLAKATRLKVVARAGVGVDNVGMSMDCHYDVVYFQMNKRYSSF